MARTTAIDDEKLLQAAREVFLEKGFNAKTTDIAKYAGISSGSIFRRYCDKETLFLEAMKPEAHSLEQFLSHAETNDLKLVLETVANIVFESARQNLPRAMMAWAQRLESADHQAIQDDIEVNKLKGFLDKALEAGQLRPSLDTWITARTIVGTMHYMAWLETVTQNPEPDTKSFIKGFIDTLWKGMIANPESN